MVNFLFQIFQMLVQDSLKHHTSTSPKDSLFVKKLHFRKSEESRDKSHSLDEQSNAKGNHPSVRFDRLGENGLELHQHP
jgi:hypothetical protein